MHALVHAADIQDRDGGAMLMATLFGLYPFLLKLYADRGYQGPVFQQAMKAIMAQVDVDIVKRSDQATGFVVLVHPAGTGGSVCIVEASRICHSRPEISGPAFLARVGHRQSMTTDRQSKGRRSDAGTQGFTDSIVV